MTKLSAPEQALGNRLLSALPEEEFARLLPHLSIVSVRRGEVLLESGQQLAHVYFPTTALISLFYIMEDGATAEIGVTGNEGLVGIPLIMGGETTPSRAIVQSAGEVVRLRAQAVYDEFAQGGRFQALLLRYTQALLTQVSLTAVCNRLHSIDQQLCRWLLLSHDQLPSGVLSMTHDQIASNLGVRREGVARAAKRLQDAGLIDYVRGTIRINDRVRLEKQVCECYKVVKDEYRRLLG